MPKEIVHIKQFHGGINDAAESTDIADNESQVADDVDFSVIGKIRTAGDFKSDPATDPANLQTIVNPGQGLFSFQSDRDTDGTAVECSFYVSHDSDVITVWDTSDTTWTTIVAHGTSALQWNDTDAQPNFLFHDGVLRISDSDHANTANERMWWGYISREHFTGASGANTITAGMHTKYADLTAPGGGQTQDGSAAPATGIMNIDPNVNTTGSLLAGSYTFAYSIVYDDIQESLLKTMTNAITVADDGSFDSSGNGPTLYFHSFDGRATGVRVYVQNSTTGEKSWTLLIDVDFAKGYRLGLSGNYTNTFTGSGTTISLPLTGDPIKRLGPETYQSINGYEFDELIDCSYKSAVVVDGITYAGNVIQGGVQYVDRMIKCAIVRDGIASDVFPASSFIDVTPNDGDSIIKLETFADKVLVFKKRKLFIVSYSETVGDYLDQTYDFMGIVQPGHSFTTAHGIVFMNNLGVHLYDGETVRTLTGKKEDITLTTPTSPIVAQPPKAF